jgi:hypothetical protein
VFEVLEAAPGRARREREALAEELDRAVLASLAGAPFDVDAWALAALRLRSEALLPEALEAIGAAFGRPGLDDAAIYRVLGLLGADDRLVWHLTYTGSEAFWRPIARRLRLAPNVRGETIDLTGAAEESPALGFRLIAAQRVGLIVPGRRALVLTAPNGTVTYVRGSRGLLFEIAAAGGRIDRMGNTLAVRGGARRDLHRGLMEVERLDTLANVDARALLPEMDRLGLPGDHPARRLVEEAPRELGKARMLADLMIELVVGVDADVARRLARQRRRGGR